MNRENLMSEYREGIKCQICGNKITREDFYYDNYDDFFDYEEAEDYQNEYGE